MFINMSINEIAKETENKVRWDAVIDNTNFALYIPKWRVPQPWPKVIYVTVSDETEKIKAYQPVTPEAADADPNLCTQKILAGLKLVKKHSNTIRYSPTADDPKQWEIGEPYIPYCLLPKDCKEPLLIEINWESF